MNLLDLLFPRRCVGCGEWGSYLCSKCINRLRPAGQVCPMCGVGSSFGVTHARCRKKMGMEGLVKVFEYKGMAKLLITKLKYRLVTDLADDLVEVIVSLGEFTPLERDGWIVVPVPLHKLRERWRGFNQAKVIGKRVAKYFGWKYEPEMLVRIRNTKPQVSIEGKDQVKRRYKNIAGAFALNSKVKSQISKLDKMNVLLVDDVWTTGATMRECAKVLKRAGAKGVWGLVVAG